MMGHMTVRSCSRRFRVSLEACLAWQWRRPPRRHFPMAQRNSLQALQVTANHNETNSPNPAELALATVGSLIAIGIADSRRSNCEDLEAQDSTRRRLSL